MRPSLKHLPNASLVQAAISTQSQEVIVFAITPEEYSERLATVAQDQQQAWKDDVTYLRNMSCVGDKHPWFQDLSARLVNEYGVGIQMEPVPSRSLSYTDLSSLLQIGGVEVLIIDAEGHDCTRGRGPMSPSLRPWATMICRAATTPRSTCWTC